MPIFLKSYINVKENKYFANEKEKKKYFKLC